MLPKLAEVGVGVCLSARGRRCLAKVQVVYWGCAETETENAWSAITSGGVETAHQENGEKKIIHYNCWWKFFVDC